MSAGVAYSSTVQVDGFSPVFGDYDLDGDLDLWIGGWHDNPETGEWDATRLFRNNGDGTFTDVTVEAGVFDPLVRGFSAIFCDMNGDRFPELLVAADFGTSRYFINNGDGTFSTTPSANGFLMAGSDPRRRNVRGDRVPEPRPGRPGSDGWASRLRSGWRHGRRLGGL